MTFEMSQLEKYEVLKNDCTDVDAVLNEKRGSFTRSIASKISDIIGENAFKDIDDNIEYLGNVSDETIELVRNNIELKKYVLTYIYWKYKHGKATKTFKLNDAKNAFGVKTSEKIDDDIHHIKYKIKCTLCGEEGEVSIESHTKIRSFRCCGCGHIDKDHGKTRRNEKSYTYCNCDYCKGIREEIKNFYTNLILNGIKECEEIIKNAPSYLNVVEDERMLKDFKIFNSCLCKDTKQIIEQKPKDIKELNEIKEKISRTKYKNKSSYLKSIDKKLLDKNIVYSYLEKDNSVTAYKLLYYYLRFYNDWKIERNVGIELHNRIEYYKRVEDYEGAIYKLLSDIDNIDEFLAPSYGCGIHVLRFNGVSEFMHGLNLNSNLSIYAKRIRSVAYKEKFKLNPYFFNPVSTVNEKKSANFKSRAEMSVHSVLQNRYPSSDGYVILSNPKLSDYIDMDDIYDIFKKAKADYVSRCYVDFLILENETPYKVYELQKGEHHNESGWIRKDKIKKIACLASGLLFEEYF